MKKITLSLAVLPFLAFGQSPKVDSIFKKVEKTIIETDADDAMLITHTAFNKLMQKNVSYYLTGNSDLTLAEFYATYTSEDDRLKLNFNIPLQTRSKRLWGIVNPIFEGDLDNSFAAVYSDKQWTGDIRVGTKFTVIPGRKSAIWFYNKDSEKYKKPKLKVVRTRTYNELKEAADKAATLNKGRLRTLGGESIDLRDLYEEPSDKDLKELEDSLYNQIAKAELTVVEKDKAVNQTFTYWFSTWAMYPVVRPSRFTTPSYSQPFSSTKYCSWELNLQGSAMLDGRRWGTLQGSVWLKYYNNNSADAELMETVDYHQYQNVPSATPGTLASAVSKDSKGYVGEFSQFRTSNLNLQVVYLAWFRDMLIRPGISVRYEMNYGEYKPQNIRIGIPLAIRGKDAPINLEPQIRLNDLENKIKVSVGISLGLPITLLY